MDISTNLDESYEINPNLDETLEINPNPANSS